MKIKLLAFGIAKDILNNRQTALQMQEGANIQDLKNQLLQQYPEFQKLKSLSIAVGTEYRSDDFVLSPSDEVVIIPPVSGG